MPLTNLGNLRLQDYWVGRNNVRRDYRESTVVAIDNFSI